MVAYNERILATSGSDQRRDRARRMLENLVPEIARLEQEETERVARIERSTPPASTFEGQLQRWRDGEFEYEVVPIPRASELLGSSLAPGAGARR